MTRLSPPLLLALGLALVAGCSPTPSSTGSAQFAVSVPQALSASITRVSVTSSGADMAPITVELAPTGGVWGGYIGNIPAGTDRTFVAEAFEASGTTPRFKGSISGIIITAGLTSPVAITLQDTTTPTPFQNAAPVIDSLFALSFTVPAGGTLSLTARAHDPNPGDTITYAWTSTAGSFSPASADTTTWTAPATPGIQTLTFTVKDDGGLSASISLTVNVIVSGQGTAKLDITFNTSPVVTGLNATVSQLAVGQSTSITASASDADGDSLTYDWSATCAGTWANKTSSIAQFTPSALPAGLCNNCELTVTVSDGEGLQTTGTLSLCVSTPASNHLEPVITTTYGSSDSASAGQELTFEVRASDPEGSPLSFSWVANTGVRGTETTGTSTSRTTWTAPACVPTGTVPTITATVTNTFGKTATKSFTVTGLPVCSG